jgi:hypothetical protein
VQPPAESWAIETQTSTGSRLDARGSTITVGGDMLPASGKKTIVWACAAPSGAPANKLALRIRFSISGPFGA